MKDLISREEMISQLEYCLANFTDYKEALEDTLRKVKGTRGVEPQEWISIKEAYTKGEWLFEPTQNINNPWKCSCCGHRAGRYKYKTYKFCPWCGAKMDKGEETQRPYKEYQDLRTGEYIREYKGEEDNETETWNGIHAQITAPKGTFDKIWNDTDAKDDI